MISIHMFRQSDAAAHRPVNARVITAADARWAHTLRGFHEHPETCEMFEICERNISIRFLIARVFLLLICYQVSVKYQRKQNYSYT